MALPAICILEPLSVHRPRFNHHKSHGGGIFVGQGYVDHGLVPGWSQVLQTLQGTIGQRNVGAPDGRLTTARSFMNTPREKPVPKAFAQASLAAKRLA